MSGIHDMKSEQSTAANRRATQSIDDAAEEHLSAKESFLSMRSTRIMARSDQVSTPRNDVTLHPTCEPRRLGDSDQLRPTIRGGSVLPPSCFEQSMERIIASWTFLMSGQQHPLVVDSVWTTSHAHALRNLPSFFISNRRWSECKQVMCSLCYVSESIRTLGMGTTKDNFATLAAAGKYFDDCSADTTKEFEDFLNFAQECEGAKHERHDLGSLLPLAERSRLQSCKAASRSLVSKVRAMISEAEELVVSPGKEVAVRDRDPASESVIQYLQCFESKRGADALSRPWKARLYAVLDQNNGASRAKSGPSPDRELVNSVSTFSENFESSCQQLYQESHASSNVSYMNEQHSILTQTLSMVLERQPVVLIAGSPGVGKSAVLSMLYAGLKDVKPDGMSIVSFMKMPWHDISQANRYLIQEILGRKEDVDGMTLFQAFECIATDQCKVLMLDGFSASERTMLKSAALKLGGRQNIVLVMTCDDTPSEDLVGVPGTIMIPPLDNDDRKEMIQARAEQMQLALSAEELEEIACKQDAGIPQYVVYALGSLAMQDSAEERNRVCDLPGTITNLLLEDEFGVLTSLEASFGKSFVRSVLFWFALVSPALRLADVCVLLSFQVSSFPDQFWSDVETTLSLFVRSYGRLSVMPSSLIDAARRRYGWSSPANLDSFASFQAERMHLQFETDISILQTLAARCREVDATDAVVQRAERWLASEALLAETMDIDSLEQLVLGCGQLSGSSDLDDAKLKLEVRSMLGMEKDLGRLATLCSGYGGDLKFKMMEAEDAKRLVHCERRLAQEHDYRKMAALVQTLEGYTGPQLDEARDILKKVALLPSATSLEVLREHMAVCGAIRACDIVTDALTLFDLEDVLASEMDIERVSEALTHYNKLRVSKFTLLEKSENFRKAETILAAEATLRSGEADITEVRRCVEVCAGVSNSAALERSLTALTAEAELASEKRCSEVKRLLGLCSFLTGSSVIEHKKQVLGFERRLRTWVPFTLIQSLAKKLKATLGSDDMRDRIQTLFAEIDEDNSGFISRDEMEKALERLGVQISKIEMENFMQGMDADGAGEVDQLEFLSFVESLIAKSDTIVCEDEELEEIGRLIEGIQGDLEASTAVEEARFKILLNTAQRVNDLSWLTDFFKVNQEQLDRSRLTSPEIAAKRKWIEAEKELTGILKQSAHVVRPTMPKRDLWAAMQRCGELENSTSLLRAKRIMDAEKELMFENSAPKIRELLKLCGILIGSPAVQRARKLLGAEINLERTISGVQCCTIEAIKHAIQQCQPLTGFEVLDEARVVVACELVLEKETRSAAIRRVLPLCDCVKGSKVLERCRRLLEIEDSIAETMEGEGETFYNLNPTDIGAAAIEVVGEEVYNLLAQKASSFKIHRLQLSREVTDGDLLRQQVALCGSQLTDSVVMDQARDVVEALESLPWTDSLDEMSHIRDAIVKQLGSKYLSPERQRARLKQIFDEFDDDASGAIDRDEIDRAFFLLGVHINSWDLQKLMNTYDNDGTGEIDFFEFQQMVELMIRGAKWNNSTVLADVRKSVALCGYLTSGRHTEWLFLARDWLKAVEKLERGVSDHQDLLATVDACGPISESAAMDQAVLVLQAAVELQVAATDERIHEMMAVCGHLGGLEVLKQKRSWLDAENQLRALNYHLESSEWLPSSHAQLWKIVECCGGLTASKLLMNAMLALQAETDLGRTQDGVEIRRLLGICGHLTESQIIDQRRSWITCEQELKTAVDLAHIKQLCEICGELQNSEVVAASRHLLDVESGLSNAFTEEDLRDGLAELEGKITGSDTMREAALRYQQFSMRRKALDTMHQTTDSAELTDSLQTLLLCNLFVSLDVNQFGHLTFKDIRSALQRLGIQPDVEAIGAATALFDVPETIGLSVFLHLALGNVGRDMETLVDAGVVVQTMHEKEIVPKAVLVEEVLSLLHAGEPDSLIYYHSFKTFLCTQMEQNGLDVKTLRTKMPEFKLPAELEHKVKWIDAELTLPHNCNYSGLLTAIEKCGALTGSALLDEARSIVAAAKAVASEPDIDVVRDLLSRCGHLEGCQSVTDAKGFLVMERWLSEATDYGAIKFYLHACSHLSSPAIASARELIALHDSLLDHVLEKQRDRVQAILEELGNRVSNSELVRVATCWTAVSSVLTTEQTGAAPDATATSQILSALDQGVGVAVRDYYFAISGHLRRLKDENEGMDFAQPANLSPLYVSLRALENELMDVCRRMKGTRPSAPMVQSVVDQTLLLNQWKIMLDPFLDGVCKDVNPRIMSGYVALCVDSRRWTRCAEIFSNLFYLRSRIYDDGVSALITDIASMARTAETCGQIHPATMRKLYSISWFCESRREQLEGSPKLLPLCLESVGLHASRHDSRSTFSSAHYAQEGSQHSLLDQHTAQSSNRIISTVEWEGSGKVGWEGSRKFAHSSRRISMVDWEGSGKVGWEGSGKFAHAQVKLNRRDSDLGISVEDSGFPSLTVNGYGELFSLKSLELEMQEVAEKLVERAKTAITEVELLSTAFRADAVLTGKKAVLKARKTVRGLHFLRVVCSLGLEDALSDKNWVRRLSCVLEEDALHEPLKLHAHAASLDEYMDIVLDAASSDIVNWEMGDVFLSVSDIWQSWIRARWHRHCLLLKVQNDASTRMGRKWIENDLVFALADNCDIPRGAFDVESFSDDTVLVEITSRTEIAGNVANLQRQIVDPTSEFHQACDREVTLGHRPGEWQQLQIAICDPHFLDEEISFLERFVLPALQVKCQREGLKVTLDWRVLPREQLAGYDDDWRQDIRLPQGCFIGAPEEVGIGRPFFLVLGGELEGGNPEDEGSVPLQHLCQLCCGGKKHTEGLVTLSSSEGEPRSPKVNSPKGKDSRGRGSKRVFESAFRILQASEARSAGSGGASPDGTPTARGRGALLDEKRSPISPFAASSLLKQASQSPLRQGSQSPLRYGSQSPARSSAESSLRQATGSQKPFSAAELRRDLKAITAMRYCEYPPNIQRSIERNVIKASYGLSAEHVCRLADFGLMMMDRLWNTIQAHGSNIEQQRKTHSLERIAHERQVKKTIEGVELCETGVQKRVLSDALSRTAARGSLIKVGGSPGSGKSVILSKLAAMLMAKPSAKEQVVVFVKMPWHSTTHLTRYLCQVILGAEEDVEKVSLSQAFARIAPEERYVFVLDALSFLEQKIVASAVVECGKPENVVVVMSCDSLYDDEEFDGGADIIPLPPLDMDDRRQLLLTQSARMGLALAEKTVEALVHAEDAGLPQFLIYALGNLCVHETIPGINKALHGSMDKLLTDNSTGVLGSLEAMHGQELVSTFFRWFVAFEKGLTASDLNILIRDNADILPMQMPHRPAALLPISKHSLDALFTQASYFLSCSACFADSQTTCYISNPALMRAVCARYKLVPPASAWLNVSIHCNSQISKETDLRTLKTMIDITADFGSSQKRKVLGWIKAETHLAHVTDFNALRAAVASCGKLSGSDELLRAQQAFEAVRVLAYERDIEKVRTLCHNYRIVTSHPSVDYARDILKTEAEMVMERRIDVLTKLYQKCQRYHGSATISKVARILEAEQELPNLVSFFDIRRSLSVCAGIVGSPKVENAKAVVSAVEHLTLRKQIPKVQFDALVDRVPESRELMLRYWIVHPRVRPPAMIWNEDTTNTLRRHHNKLRDAATEVQVDPAPILEEFWESFDEIVMKLTMARDQLEKEEGTAIMLEEDHNSIIQDALLKCHFLTDVPIITLMMRRRQAAADLAHERRIAVVMEKLEICGMIRSNRTVDAAKEALKSEKGLLTERHVPTIKRLMDKCQWLENSEGVLWAADVLDRIERMRPFIYTGGAGIDRTSSTASETGEQQGHIPAKDLMEFLANCSSLTGSDVIDRACEMAASMARLEQDKDKKLWKDLLTENGWYERHPSQLSTQTSWDQMEVASLLKICRSIHSDDTLNRARKYVASSKELTRLITPHINIGIRQLKEVLKQCGPLCGIQTAVHTVQRIYNLHTRIKPEEREWLEQLLEAWRRPNENVEFVGWEKIVDFLPQILPSSALTDILPAISIERARRCVEALRQIESDNPPTSVPTLLRLMAECSQVPMSNKLDFLRQALTALNALKWNHHIDAVRLAVSRCSKYDSSDSPALSLARDQVVALEQIETELQKDVLEKLVGCCEGLVGSATLDRDRGWLAADAKLATERRIPQVRKELELCGELQDSRNMDTARMILDRLATLKETREAVEVRKLVEYLDSENATEDAHLDETRTVLMLETSLPTRVDSIDLVHALIQVDERLTESVLSAQAHVRLHVILETEWKKVCEINTLPVLKKFHELGLEMVMKSGFNYAYLSSLHAVEGKDFMQAWTEVGARLLAVENLNGETDFKTISELLKVIGVIHECPIADEARGWIESIHALEQERDAAVVEELVSKCGPVAGSDVLALAKQRVLTLAALEKGDSSTFDIQTLREYCTLCEHLFGNAFLDKCRAAVAAVGKLQEFNHIGFMHRYICMWEPLQRPDLPTTTQQIFQLINNLEQNKEIAVVREAAAPLRQLQQSDEIRHTKKWLQTLHVSKDLRNESFTVVSKEPRHVTVSEQAQQMYACLGFAPQVTGDATLDKAREVEAFFRPEQPPADAFRRVPPDLGLVEGLESKQRGKQMEALLACLQTALENEVFLAACTGLDAESALEEERSLPKVAELVALCDEFSSPLITKARAVLAVEKQLIYESEYDALKELLKQCEGYSGSKVVDVARHKMATLDALEGCVDYFKIRDVVPHVKITGCQALEDAQWIDFLVRDMMQTRSVGRLQQILQELSEKHVVGFPEMDRVRELLELEKQIDGIKELDQLSAALRRIGNRISDSDKINAAKSRLDQLAHAVGEKSRCSDLRSASFWGNTMAIEYFLELDPEGVHTRNEHGETPLHNACAGGVINGVRLLLSRGAKPHAVAKNGSTPLHEAAAAGHTDIVALLLSLVPDIVDARASVLRHTALLLAAKEGYTDVIEVLLDQGKADIDAADATGNTAVMRALAAGHRDSAKLLCKRHCNLRATNSDGYTCLHLAARMGYTGLVSKCVRLGLSAMARTRAGFSPLHLAAMAGEADLCAYLLRKGAEVNEQDGWGSTALHHASRAGSAEVVGVLLMAGADPRIRNWEGRGWKALDMSASKEVDAMLYKGLYPINTDFHAPEMAAVDEHDTCTVEQHDTSTVLDISLPVPRTITLDLEELPTSDPEEEAEPQSDAEQEEPGTEAEAQSKTTQDTDRSRALARGGSGSGWAALRSLMLPKPSLPPRQQEPPPGVLPGAGVNVKGRMLPVKVMQRGRTPLAASLASTPAALSQRSDSPRDDL